MGRTPRNRTLIYRRDAYALYQMMGRLQRDNDSDPEWIQNTVGALETAWGLLMKHVYAKSIEQGSMVPHLPVRDPDRTPKGLHPGRPRKVVGAKS